MWPPAPPARRGYHAPLTTKGRSAMTNQKRLLLALLLLAAPRAVQAAAPEEPFPPHRLADNLYYVGSKDLATYLITTPKGHVLINSGFESTVPLIKASVE